MCGVVCVVCVVWCGVVCVVWCGVVWCVCGVVCVVCVCVWVCVCSVRGVCVWCGVVVYNFSRKVMTSHFPVQFLALGLRHQMSEQQLQTITHT